MILFLFIFNTIYLPYLIQEEFNLPYNPVQDKCCHGTEKAREQREDNYENPLANVRLAPRQQAGE